MFHISSLLTNESNSNATDTEEIYGSFFTYRKNPYRVLAAMPKSTVFCFYMRSILTGLWVLLKWTFHFLWNIVGPASSASRRLDKNSIEYYGSLHDKPPPCLVDNRIGLQSYVKLKVNWIGAQMNSKWIRLCSSYLIYFIRICSDAGHEIALHWGG